MLKCGIKVGRGWPGGKASVMKWPALDSMVVGGSKFHQNYHGVIIQSYHSS